MRRDSIFYRLFQRSPTLLFELLATPPTNATGYRFDSVAVKEPKFEIDGVFLPPDSSTPGVVYFCEVQFQKDDRLYERLFSEAFLYFYRNRERYGDWEAVVIYPSRSMEQSNSHPYRALLDSTQVHRVYLNELGEMPQLPLELALMLLTTVEAEQAPEAARSLLDRAQQEELNVEARRSLIELVTTIMVYKLGSLSRSEVETMLDLNLRIQDTRVYQEAREEGRQDEAVSLVLRQLPRRLQQELSEEIRSQITALPLPLLEALSEALLDLEQLADLQAWLEQHSNH